MKGVGWIVILLAMLTAVYLVVKDLDALQGGGQGGKAVLQPLEQAKGAAELAQRTQDSLKQALDKIDR